MKPDEDNRLGGLPLNINTREWIDLTPYLSGAFQFPAVDLILDKQDMTQGALTIQRYPAIQCRINADGLVVFRGLLQRTVGGNFATGETIATFPRWLMPRHPQELRWYGGGYMLRLNPQDRKLVIDIVHTPQSWIILQNVIYYLD